RRGSGVTPLPAHRSASLIPAKKCCSSRSRANDLIKNKTMKIKPITTIAAIAFLPIAGFAQTPPAPPAPPSQPGLPAPPGPPHRHERAPKVPIIFLGLETSEI